MIMVMQWWDILKMPLFTPYLAQISGGEAYLNEGNHTFRMLVDEEIPTIDINVHPAIIENTRELYGTERPTPNPLPDDFRRTHSESLLCGLNLLQVGTVVGGALKLSPSAIIAEGEWKLNKRILSTEELAAESDRSEVIPAALSTLRMLSYFNVSLSEWVNLSTLEQSRTLRKVTGF